MWGFVCDLTGQPTGNTMNSMSSMFRFAYLQKRKQIYWMSDWHPDWIFHCQSIKITLIDWLTLLGEMAIYWTFVWNYCMTLNGHQRWWTHEWNNSQRDVFVLLIDLDQSFTQNLHFVLEFMLHVTNAKWPPRPKRRLKLRYWHCCSSSEHFFYKYEHLVCLNVNHQAIKSRHCIPVYNNYWS